MATTNPVFQVLVTKGNQPMLPADKKIEQLAPGQLGVFNYHTNLSVDGTVLPDAREVYIAMGIDRDNDGAVDDILTSAGQMIQRENVRGYNAKCYSPAKPKIVELTNFDAKCETEYGIKIEVRNQLGYLLNGYNQVAKSFVIKTSCCEQVDCTSCPEGDCNEVAVKLTQMINADVDKVFKAEMIDGPGGAVVTDAVAWAADPLNAGKCLGIRITTIPLAVKKFCTVNLGYFNPRSTDVFVSAIEGFECNGKITVTQELQNEEGLGYDIAQLEYEAGGWNGKPGPYRVSALSSVPLSSFESFVDQSAKYLEFNLIYDQFSVGGWLEYLNNLNTIIAIPCADTTTRNSFATFFDRIFAGVGGFGPLADDVALCNCSGAGTPTSSIDDTSKDGIG